MTWSWQITGIFFICCVLITLYGVYALNLETEARYMSYETHQDTGFWLYLQPSIEIPDGGEVNLPIEVFESAVTLDGNYGYKVVEVSSPIRNFWYGEGEEINITVTFTDTVYVTGTPKLLLYTGCHDDDCHTKEVQSFTCAADSGAFAITFNGNTVPNIHVNSSQEQLKYALETLDDVVRVAVAYSYADNAERSSELSRRRACTSQGNEVTVTFYEAYADGTDGDLPEMTLDADNELVDPQTGHSVGDGTFLVHGSEVYLDATATEVTTGVKYEDREAVYIAGSGTNQLIFQYIVQAGDSSDDLDYADQSSLYCDDEAGAEDCGVVGANEVDANLTLPWPGDDYNYRYGIGSSLGANKNIIINTDSPVVEEVTTIMDDGAYGLSDVLFIDVVFDQPIAVSGSPTLELETGDTDATATFHSYFNHTVRFKFVVGSLDQSGDLEYTGTDALDVPDDAWIRRDSTTPTTDANVTLPTTFKSGSLAYSHKLVIYNTGPRIVDITSSKPDGTYSTGEVFNISVAFGFTDEDRVDMALEGGEPALYLATGSTAMFAVRTAENGSNVIEFDEGHGLEANGTYDIGLEFLIGGRIYTVAAVDNNLITMEEPYVGDEVSSGVTAAGAGVNVSTPGYRRAAYLGGAGTPVLTFQYMALPGDFSPDLEVYGAELELAEGATLHRLALNSTADADLTLMANHTCATPIYGCSLGGNKDIVIDSTQPKIVELTSTKPSALGPYGVRDTIDITVHFSLNVSTDPDAPNTPRLLMDTYSYAAYSHGSGTTALTFLYSVRSGDVSPDFDAYNVSAIGLLSPLAVVYSGITGYIRRKSTIPLLDASLFVPAPRTSGSLSYTSDLAVDTSAPYIVQLSALTPDGTYGAGHAVLLLAEFSEAVLVVNASLPGAGPPYFYLETGDVDRVARYLNGTGTVNVTFVYEVVEGDHADDLDVKEIQEDLTHTTVIYRNGSAVVGAATGAAAVLTLPFGAADADSLAARRGLDINTTAPTVVNVTSNTADGTYSVGQEILIYVEFSFEVAVTGTPQLVLELGVNDKNLNFTGFGDDQSVLVFTYNVEEDQYNGDLDYVGQDSLVLPFNGTTIKRKSTNPTTDADLTLPKNGGRGSLGFNGALQIDTSTPTVARVFATAAPGAYGRASLRQTVDVYGDDTLTDGSFLLTYSEFSTPCLDVVALNASALAAALNNATRATGALNVSVREADRPYPYARRYVVDFLGPSAGVAALAADLTSCTTFQCGGAPCSDRGVEVNRDIGQADLQNGTLEIIVEMSQAVVVDTTWGTPRLYLDAGQGGPNASYAEYGPARSQEIYVGAGLEEAITAGQFRLTYGDATTGCVDYKIATSQVRSSALRNRLLELEEVAALGLDAVTVEADGHGYIFNVTFAQGEAPRQLEVAANWTGCTAFEPADTAVEVRSYGDRLHFHYAVREGDYALDLGYPGAGALRRWNATVLRYSTNPSQTPDLTLPTPGKASSLSGTGLIQLDGRDNPRIISVSSEMYADSYAVGDQVNLTVTFDQAVTVDSNGGTPYFLLNVGDTPGEIRYASSSNASLLFQYEIVDGDDTTDLEYYSTTSLTQDGGLITSNEGLRFVIADLDLPAKNGSLSFDGGALVIDTSAPRITNVFTQKVNGTFGVGEQIMILVAFSAPVEVSGTPALALNSGGSASYAGLQMTVQSFDVGFRATTNITAGEFQLSYDAYTTGCVPFHDPDTLRAELRALAALDGYNVSVNATRHQGGYRYAVSLAGGDAEFGDYPLELEVAALASGTCEAFVPSGVEVTNAPTTIIGFNYAVGDGEAAERLDIDGADALSGGSIKRWSRDSTTSANLNLTGMSLYPSYITVNSSVPFIQNVTSYPSSGNLTFQDQLIIYVKFSEPVAVGGSADPVLTLSNGFTASFQSGSYSRVLEFLYEVGGEAEAAASLDASSLATSGWVRRASSAPTTAAALGLPAAGAGGALADNGALAVVGDRVRTYVTAVTSPHADGTFTVGEEILILVHFYRPVNFTGAPPQLALEVGEDEPYKVDATNFPGRNNFTSTLNFSYVIQSGHSNEDLSYYSTGALTLPNGTRLTDSEGAAVDLALPSPGSLGSLSYSSAIAALTVAPVVTAVDAGSEDGRYVAGDWVNISISFHVPVIVYEGTPALQLKTGDAPTNAARAYYAAGSGTRTLWFTYVVQEGDGIADLNYEGAAALEYPTIAEQGARVVAYYEGVLVDADLRLPAMDSGRTLADRAAIELDTSRPYVERVYTAHADGRVGVGEVVDVAVRFSHPVAVHGLVFLQMECGDEDYDAYYLSGSGTSDIVFRYIVQEGDKSADLEYVDTRSSKSRVKYSRALHVEVGTSYVRAHSRDPVTDALLFLPLPGAEKALSGSANITIDTARPVVELVTAHNPNAVYGVGSEINISVAFSQPVTLVDALPSLLMETGVADRYAEWYEGNNSKVLWFLYTVQRGDYTEALDYKDTGSLVLYQDWREAITFEGALRRTATVPTQDADLTLPEPGEAKTAVGPYSLIGSGTNIAIQTGYYKAIAATSYTDDGTYGVGEEITIEVTFSVAVDVGDPLPQVALSLDNRVAYCNYTGGTGTEYLTFLYKVEAGDSTSDLSYLSSDGGIMALYGSLVTALNNAILDDSLPAPGDEHSLSYNKDIAIDTAPPRVAKVTSDHADGEYGAGELIGIYVHFTYPVVMEEGGAASLTLAVGGEGGGAYTVYYAGPEINMTNPQDVILFEYLVVENHTSAALDYMDTSSFNGTFLRYSTNPTTYSNNTLPEPGDTGSLSAYSTVEINTEPPYVINVDTVDPDGVYRYGNPLNLSVAFSAPVVVNGSGAGFTLELGSAAADPALAEYAGGSGTDTLYFLYTVTEDDGSSHLDYDDKEALAVSGGTWCRRLSTYPTTDADLRLASRGTEGSLSDNSFVIIDNGAPYVLNTSTALEDGLYGVGQEVYIDLFFSGDVNVDEGEGFTMPLNSGDEVYASYFSGSGTQLIRFLYTVEIGDSSTDLDHDDPFSLMLSNDYTSIAASGDSSQYASIYVAAAGDPGSMSYFSDIQLARIPNFKQPPHKHSSIVLIDTNQTYVDYLDSDKQNGEYGAGEEIELLVHFSTEVTVFEPPEMYLDVGDENSYAIATYISGNNTDTLTFLYTVAQDDEALDLDVLDTCGITADTYPDLYLDLGQYFLASGCPFSVALNGSIFRTSTHPTFEVQYTLPAPTEEGSLSYNKDLIVDTAAPTVLYVASLREGTYTAGETIDIQVVFDKPVTLNGTARLAFTLDADADSSTDGLDRYATSDGAFELSAYPYISQTITFTYTVEIGDYDNEIGYANADALEIVGGGSWIKRTSTNPTTDALLNLDDDGAGNHLLKNALEIEVILESIAHESVADLEVALYHEDRGAVLLDAALGRLEFGEPKERQNFGRDGYEYSTGLSTTEKEVFLRRSRGYDYAFADPAGTRVANYRNSLQSSTLFDSVSNLALDGDPSGYFSQKSVTLTDLEDEAWWQVELLEDMDIGTIRIFGLEEENDQMEIQIVTVKATVALAGTFTVTVNNGNQNHTTAEISVDAVCCENIEDSSGDAGTGVGESMQAKLQALDNVGLVQVSRSVDSSTNSFQATWSVTFVTDTGDLPQMTLGSKAGISSYGSDVVFDTVQDGSIEGVFSFEGATYDLKTQMAPSYVMIFDEPNIDPDMTLEESLSQCVWSYYISENARQTILRVRDQVKGRTVRLQMAERGYLSVAEVEIFEYEHFPVSEYEGSSPIPQREEFQAFQPAQSLNEAFRGTAVNGNWVLRVTDRQAAAPYRKYASSPATLANGEGRLGGWTLVITDILGQRKKYNMDAYTTVTTLPKYGTLYTSLTDSGGEIQVEPGFERNLRPCYGKDYTGLNGVLEVATYETCWYNYGVGSVQGLRRLGAGAETQHIRGEMALYYQPYENYLGPDIFTYSATLGNKKSPRDGYVMVHTRDCRYNITGTEHSLCACNDPLIVSHASEQQDCYDAVDGICEDLDDNEDRYMFFRMCYSCSKDYLDNDVTSYDDFTAQCINDILKVSQYLDVKGYCEETYEIFQCAMTEKFGVYPTEAHLHVHYDIKVGLN